MVSTFTPNIQLEEPARGDAVAFGDDIFDRDVHIRKGRREHSDDLCEPVRAW